MKYEWERGWMNKESIILTVLLSSWRGWVVSEVLAGTLRVVDWILPSWRWAVDDVCECRERGGCEKSGGRGNNLHFDGLKIIRVGSVWLLLVEDSRVLIVMRREWDEMGLREEVEPLYRRDHTESKYTFWSTLLFILTKSPPRLRKYYGTRHLRRTNPRVSHKANRTIDRWLDSDAMSLLARISGM